jgi:hypothetical protein
MIQSLPGRAGRLCHMNSLTEKNCTPTDANRACDDCNPYQMVMMPNGFAHVVLVTVSFASCFDSLVSGPRAEAEADPDAPPHKIDVIVGWNRGGRSSSCTV